MNWRADLAFLLVMIIAAAQALLISLASAGWEAKAFRGADDALMIITGIVVASWALAGVIFWLLKPRY